ncbi:MAG: RagB/SusD family nutrient uptake outer membrane protein [Candidatus Pedobacter colombiensis]|uniref:RagB/SusD family nutrient uptake outer membrane protein n=1 Tax=Candidatus Pedobacter colombiensis TaxID=3121371 RepID=A0AAJ6B5M2_9SPHI|nr:RagB/SusD family nutrient uptake outer membrane protein [Pedobacter sp.]WEK18902.1 MAG: RagB/SusD family nutrient uptake outer membrane protein [Pedobacter sp.]
MKKIFITAASLCVLLTLGSCRKFLTEVSPTTIKVTNYYTKVGDINSTLAGLYGSFQVEMLGDGTNKYGGKYHYWGEIRSDNFEDSGYRSSISTQMAFNTLTSGNTVSNWEGLYRTIAIANNCIKYFPVVPNYDKNATQAIVNAGLAQAYAMRAMCYFYIVRLWGDAPLRTEPYGDLSQEPRLPRTSKDEIMNKVIIPDLQTAYDLIPKQQSANIWYINEAAIAAIAADVAMWNAGTKNNAADYVTAIAWFKKVFAAKGQTGVVYGETNANLEPTATWKNLFLNPTTTKESIWSINWNSGFNGCACIPIGKQKSNNPVMVDSLIHATWKLNKLDTRVLKTIDTLRGINHQDKVLKYYNYATQIVVNDDPIPLNIYAVMYRLGDMFLLYAEALNKTGDRVNALKMMNLIHVRAGMPAILATDPSVSTGGVLDETKLEDAILKERQYETFAEGKRWFDLVRTNHVFKVMDPILDRRRTLRYGVPSSSGFAEATRILWPIYKTLLEDNTKLVQNQPYN